MFFHVKIEKIADSNHPRLPRIFLAELQKSCLVVKCCIILTLKKNFNEKRNGSGYILYMKNTVKV
jgi:hypothetical protein